LAPVGLSLRDACSAGTRERDYARPSTSLRVLAPPACPAGCSGASPSRVRLPAADTLKRYYKALEYEYRVKTAALQWWIQESKPVGPASRSYGTKPYMLQ
jgi:hypothetical protein